MEKQLSLELEILSSGKQQNSPGKKHLSSKKRQKQRISSKRKEKNKKGFKYIGNGKELQNSAEKQGRQPVIELLPKRKEEHKLESLSLEGVKAENTLKETPPDVHSPKKELLFDNQIYLISVKTVAEMLGLAPKTIHNWVYLRKIPYVKCGQKVMFRPKSLKAWLNRKEIKSWL